MIFVLIYTLFSVLLAFTNYLLIKKGKRIFHGLNGFVHVLVAVVLAFSYGWPIGVATLFFVRAVFDSALNKFRKLPLGYISPSPKSIVDKIEIKAVLFVVSRTAKGVIVNDTVHKTVVLFRILYVIIGLVCLIA